MLRPEIRVVGPDPAAAPSTSPNSSSVCPRHSAGTVRAATGAHLPGRAACRRRRPAQPPAPDYAGSASRARPCARALGDLVQLTFVNQVELQPLRPQHRHRGLPCASAQNGSDLSRRLRQPYPNCLHASSTANIHFHGTHTSPSGDRRQCLPAGPAAAARQPGQPDDHARRRRLRRLDDFFDDLHDSS